MLQRCRGSWDLLIFFHPSSMWSDLLLDCDCKLLNPFSFFLLIVIGFLILLKFIKFFRLNEITLVDFDEVIILNLIVVAKCDWKIWCWILYHFAFPVHLDLFLCSSHAKLITFAHQPNHAAWQLEKLDITVYVNRWPGGHPVKQAIQWISKHFMFEEIALCIHGFTSTQWL